MQHILCVDDNSIIRNLLQHVFVKSGYKCFVCKNGIEALKVVKEVSIDIAIIDIMLPQMTGFELLKNLKALRPDLYVFVLSAKKNTNDLIHAYDLGAEEYLTKPFDVKELVIKTELILKRNEFSEKLLWRTGSFD